MIAALAMTIFLALSGTAPASAAEEVEDLQRLVIDVTGETISGPRYGGHLEVERTASGWALTRSCWRLTVASPAADCGCSGTREIEQGDVRKLVAFIATLKDGGDRAECCDHPYSKVERRYSSTRPALTTVPFDVLQEKEMPDLCGAPSPKEEGPASR